MPGRSRGRPFQKGHVANPVGRRPGSQNKLTKVLRDLITPAARPIVKDIIKKARDGDANQQKIFVQHLLPSLKFIEPPLADFPLVTNAREAITEIAKVTQRMAQGEIDTDAAHAIIDKLKTFIVGYSAVELEAEVLAAKLREEGKEP
jgi:hypothetical protein